MQQIDFNRIDLDDPRWSWQFSKSRNYGAFIFTDDDGTIVSFPMPKCFIQVMVNLLDSRKVK